MTLVPEHYNKVYIAIKWANEYFGFTVHIKIMCILYCSLFKMCNSIVSKNVYVLI